MSEELKPCPFCGQTPGVVKCAASYVVGCPGPCYVKPSVCAPLKYAAKRWNQRTPPAPKKTDEELVEMMSSVGWKSEGHDGLYEDVPDWKRNEYRRAMRAALAVVREAGASPNGVTVTMPADLSDAYVALQRAVEDSICTDGNGDFLRTLLPPYPESKAIVIASLAVKKQLNNEQGN